MPNEAQKIEAEIKKTRQALEHDWTLLEFEMKNQIQVAKDKIEDTKRNIKLSFSVTHQVQKHPLEMVTGALVLGFTAGSFLLPVGRVRTLARLAALPAAKPLLGRALTPFKSELGVIKGLVAATLFEKAASALAKKLPGLQKTLDTVSQNVYNKLSSSPKPERVYAEAGTGNSEGPYRG